MEPELITQQLYGGDVAVAAAVITQMTSLSGLLEFSLTPSLGRLSDVVGRRPFFIVCPALVALSNGPVALACVREASLCTE